MKNNSVKKILFLYVFLFFSNLLFSQYPGYNIIIHPYLQFDYIGNCFTVGSDGELYFGTVSNKIYNIYDFEESKEFDTIYLKSIEPGIKFRTGCIHKNGEYFILGNTWGSQLIIRYSDGTKCYDFDLSNEGIVTFIKYIITKDDANETIYYFGTSDINKNWANIVKLIFNKSNPCLSTLETIKIIDDDVDHTFSLVQIGNYLFISSNCGKIYRYNLNSGIFLSPIDSGIDCNIRNMITDGISLYAILENSDINKTFWRIDSPTTSNPNSRFGPIGNIPIEPNGKVMYFKNPYIYI